MAETKAATKKAPAKKTATKKAASSSAAAKKAPAKKAVAKKAPAQSGFAVIETGGKQYIISEGNDIRIEKLSGEHKVGDKLVFDKVLLVDDGSKTTVGDPYIKDAKVEAELTGTGRNKKVMVIRFKSKSRYFKKRGHRQPYMNVKISSVK